MRHVMLTRRMLIHNKSTTVALASNAAEGRGIIGLGMAETIQSANETTDPRILRSRRMLMEALARLLIKKELEDISVQEITGEATLNRATFYLHYPDKNALLQAMTDARFRDLMERRAISFTDCHGALRAVALGVCDYLAENASCPSQLARIPLESSIIPVVEGMFTEGISHHELPPGADAGLLATTAAWAVFGAARRWFQSPDRIPAEEMAAKIETMVSPVLFGGYPSLGPVMAAAPSGEVSRTVHPPHLPESLE
jgi:AcrR family transcriptional regulator